MRKYGRVFNDVRLVILVVNSRQLRDPLLPRLPLRLVIRCVLVVDLRSTSTSIVPAGMQCSRRTTLGTKESELIVRGWVF